VVLSLLLAVLLAPSAWHDLTHQISFPAAGYAQSGEWIYSVLLAVLLVFGGLLSATERAGWNVLGILIGVALLYLGVAALVAPSSPGSWGTLGGVLAVLGGVAYISFTCYEMWKVAKRPALSPRHQSPSSGESGIEESSEP
jgi:FtsH-binding integral membrane protein